MSEIRSISEGSFVLGDTNNLTFEAGTGIKITEPSEGTVRIANDETVLYSNGTGTSATCSEAPSNFERIKIFYNRGADSFIQEYPGSPNDNILEIFCAGAFTNGFVSFYTYRYAISGSTISPTSYLKETFGNSTLSVRDANAPTIKKVIGINRISGGNA